MTQNKQVKKMETQKTREDIYELRGGVINEGKETFYFVEIAPDMWLEVSELPKTQRQAYAWAKGNKEEEERTGDHHIKTATRWLKVRGMEFVKIEDDQETPQGASPELVADGGTPRRIPENPCINIPTKRGILITCVHCGKGTFVTEKSRGLLSLLGDYGYIVCNKCSR